MQIRDYVVTHIKGGSLSSELKAVWLNIVQNQQDPYFVHDVYWVSAYLRSNPAFAQSCHIFTLSQRNQTLAIYPLQYITAHRFGLQLNSWRIFWPSDMGINDFILLPLPHSHKYIVLLKEYLNTLQDYPWDLLELQNVPENTITAEALKERPVRQAVSVYHHDSKYLRCGVTYDESVAEISSKFKKNNRRKMRNLEKLGKVTTAYFNQPEELKQAFDAFLDVEAANWKGEQNSALRHDERQRCFYQELLHEYAGTGRCVIHLLYLDAVPIAGQFALISGNTLFLLKIGYNAEYQAMGPGGLLLDATLRKFSGDSVIKNISFVTGAKWNDDWAPQVHHVFNHYIYNRTYKGLVSWLAETAKSGLRKIKHKFQA